jgi:hypothetical protein
MKTYAVLIPNGKDWVLSTTVQAVSVAHAKEIVARLVNPPPRFRVWPMTTPYLPDEERRHEQRATNAMQ